MKNELGKITKQDDGFKVRFERILNYDIHTVWHAITDPEKLKVWFTDFDMKTEVGSRITITFRDENKTATYGIIVSFDPPHRFAFTWEGDLANWELFALSPNKCRLVLTYSKIDKEYAAKSPAGFHILLNRLEEMLGGKTACYPFGAENDDSEILEMHVLYGGIAYRDFPELNELKPISIESEINATISNVWQAITDREQMSQWYFKLNQFRPEIGFEFSFGGKGHSGTMYTHLCKVTEVITGRKLQYSWQYENYPGFSFVTFELIESEIGTKLKFTHEGLETFPVDNEDFTKERFDAGWTMLISESLPKYLAIHEEV